MLNTRPWFLALSSSVVIGCSSDAPSLSTASPSNTNPVATQASPVIAGLDGHRVIDPLVIDAGKHYYDSVAVDYYPTTYSERVRISGSGFGETTGQIIISDANFVIGSPSCVSWAPTVITFCATAKLDATPSVTITIVRADGVTSQPYHTLLIPTIATRVYGQCTWWVALKEIAQFGEGREPETGAYPRPPAANTEWLDDNYVPHQYDAWLTDGAGHQAFVESVMPPSTTYDAATRQATMTYLVNLSQYNVDYTEQYTTYKSKVSFSQPYDPITFKFTGARRLTSSVTFTDHPKYFPGVVWRNGPVDNAQASAYILSPVGGASIASGQAITFTGGAFRGSTSLTGASLIWTSNRDGRIGIGTSLTSSVLSSGTHTVTLTATDQNGLVVTDAVNITVTQPAPTVTASLTASPSSISSGQPSTLTWSSANAGSCTKSWSLDTSPNGSMSVTPSTTITYSISCLGLSGNVSASAKVTVTPAVAATIQVTSNVSTAWTIAGQQLLSGSGTSANYSVAASPNGDTYYIIGSPLLGYNLNAGTSDNPSCANCGASPGFTIKPGETKGFLLTYTPISSVPPAAPSNLQASSTSSGTTIDLTWTSNSSNALGFYVERCVGTGCSNFSQIGQVTSTGYTSTGLTIGTSYSYRVRAYDIVGPSLYSNVATAIATPVYPAPAIAHVVPNPVVGSASQQTFTINGADFRDGANVILRDITTGEVFSHRVIVSLSNINIVLNPTFGTAASSWTVEVINTDSKTTGQYPFQVKAP
jgi:hypothetical protein